MNDGGMGSFSIGVQEYDGVYAFYEERYTDIDNILCVITLWVNAEEIPYEVDIWKGDFSEIIEYPSDNKLYDGKFIEY